MSATAAARAPTSLDEREGRGMNTFDLPGKMAWDRGAMRAALTIAGVSQYDVADELGIDRKTVSRQLNGHRRMWADVPLVVAELCHIEVTAFISGRGLCVPPKQGNPS